VASLLVKVLALDPMRLSLKQFPLELQQWVFLRALLKQLILNTHSQPTASLQKILVTDEPDGVG
jgi:hypothetical protein